ncbi:MAG: 2-oxoacid:ferredoxin oxidoreductase subunit beta [Gammaproteobacteria bacterium]|nr:2-oxoacid:ferredoxin oxidoreductase subunit beta [Gammaproteobacteria bacterium]
MSVKAESVNTSKSKASSSYTKKDFTSDQNIRWCPGCGDYSILAQMQRVMPEICEEMDIPKENIVFVSGIGCSSRFPYYMNNYGFHTIHGRAPTIATGLRVSRPDLQVWIVTGDGDGLSIGGNHLMHCLRRNIDVKILLFNNRIYGLTKGQYSPTSEMGKKTKSSPFGTIEKPINPLSIAIASKASFIARAVDTDATNLRDILLKTARHRGSAFVEILQNCNVFNDKAFSSFTDKTVKEDRLIYLKDKEPITFGKNQEKALAMVTGESGLKEVGIVNTNEADVADILVHDESSPGTALAFLLAQLDEAEYPVPLGVFRNISKPLYGELLDEQITEVTNQKGKGEFFEHLRSGDIWTV